jgi:hypothetical protein
MTFIEHDIFVRQIAPLGFAEMLEHEALYEIAKREALAAGPLVLKNHVGVPAMPSRRAAGLFLGCVVTGLTTTSPADLTYRSQISDMLAEFRAKPGREEDE